MIPSEKQEFFGLIKIAMAAYGKGLPTDTAVLDAWWNLLSSFPMQAVRSALSAYCSENGEFAPVPAGIAKRCKLMDGRPTDEEAWAIALTSQDESQTVVWTQEAAEAFAICQSVLAMGDEVGARMAFKDAYNRLVAASRAAGKPSEWMASLGWDMRCRERTLNQAVVAGLLPAPHVAGLLPPPEVSAVDQDDVARENIANIKRLMQESQDKKAREFQESQDRDKLELQERKRALEAQAKSLKGGL